MIKKYILILFISFLFNNFLYAKTEYFQIGIDLYNKKKFEEAKFKFEQDIVLNPKNELSYLFLSKIFNIKKNNSQEEQNLNTVILLNPNNEEALYQLAKLKLINSDYKKSIEINERLKLVCKKFCDQSNKLKIEIDNLLKK
jgi:tetratricopeptide (TPR) repeat protein